MHTFDDTPVNAALGITLVQSSLEGAEVRLEDCRNFTQEGDVVHGGILTTLADTASVYVLLPGLPPGKRMTSIEFKMNFFRPGLADAGPLAH